MKNNFIGHYYKILITFCIVVSPISVQIANAEVFYSSTHGFKIDIPDDWAKTKPTKSWTLVTYAKLGSGENLNINIVDANGIKSIKEVSLKELFYPYYEHITFYEKVYNSRGDNVFLKVVYRINDGALKQKLEGKHRLKYMVISWIRDEKIFTLTFTDAEPNFNTTLPLFNKIADSIYFLKQ